MEEAVITYQYTINILEAPTTGGGCYTATYHKHSGSPTTGGGCYTSPITHTHTDACYIMGTCERQCYDYAYITGRQGCGYCGSGDSVCKKVVQSKA